MRNTHFGDGGFGFNALKNGSNINNKNKDL